MAYEFDIFEFIKLNILPLAKRMIKVANVKNPIIRHKIAVLNEVLNALNIYWNEFKDDDAKLLAKKITDKMFELCW